MNTKINVEQTIKDILEQEGQEEGIQLIRDIVNNISKNKRRTKPRVNTFDSVAKKVYELMYKDEYSRTRAITKISKEENLAESTINNHLRKFNQRARDDDYINFGYVLDFFVGLLPFQNVEPEIVKRGSDYGLPKEFSLGYYYKFQIDSRKKGCEFKENTKSKYHEMCELNVTFWLKRY